MSFCSKEPANQKPYIFAISGVKNSGKTTIIKHIVPRLKKEGFSVGVLKHDGHEFEPDVPHTDSFMIRKSGADAVGVYSKSKFMLIKEEPDLCVAELIPYFSHVDILILEGAKHSPFPKFEVIRAENSTESVCEKETLLGICTDLVGVDFGVNVFKIDDYDNLVKYVIQDFVQTAKG